MLEKGIIIAPAFTVDGNSCSLHGISGQLLRQALLYWDKIDFPFNRAIYMAGDADIEYLIGVGVMQRTEIQVRSHFGNVGHRLIADQIAALQILDANEPGQWNIAQTSNLFVTPPSSRSAQDLVELQLHNCLPVPTSDVPFADILEFKSRRTPEYEAFKSFMGELYFEIINSNDIPRARNHVVNRLENSIKDIEQVISESFVKKIHKSVSLNINLRDIAEEAVKFGVAAQGLSIPFALGAMTGAAYSALNFKFSKRSLPDEMQKNQKGLAYLMAAPNYFRVERNDLCPCGSGLKFKKCHLNIKI